MSKLYIDKNINVTTGIKAESLIDQNNDSKYLDNNAILKVDKDRWIDAQHYERKTWMEIGLSFNDDRNYEHRNRFDNYTSIDNISNSINSVIELGCGPFTNLRTLYQKFTSLKEVSLLDPLLNDYLNHPNCFYKNGKFLDYNTNIYSIPIEEYNSDKKYDLVLMNNVLEHCYDVNIIFDKILNILNNGGIFIFSDVYFKNDDADKMVYEIYDTGHPIKLSESFMNEFLDNFDIIYNNDYYKLYDQHWRNDKYFIGKLKVKK